MYFYWDVSIVELVDAAPETSLYLTGQSNQRHGSSCWGVSAAPRTFIAQELRLPSSEATVKV